jgi:hypothetical protein
MGSLKDLIVNAAGNGPKFEDVEVLQFDGGTFRVRGLPSGDWEQYQNRLNKLHMTPGKKDTAEMSITSNKAWIVAKALHDPETDELVFPDLREGVAWLDKSDAGAVNGLFNLCKYLSGDEAETDFVEKIKKAEEDFSTGQS